MKANDWKASLNDVGSKYDVKSSKIENTHWGSIEVNPSQGPSYQNAGWGSTTQNVGWGSTTQNLGYDVSPLPKINKTEKWNQNDTHHFIGETI